MAGLAKYKINFKFSVSIIELYSLDREVKKTILLVILSGENLTINVFDGTLSTLPSYMVCLVLLLATQKVFQPFKQGKERKRKKTIHKTGAIQDTILHTIPKYK